MAILRHAVAPATYAFAYKNRGFAYDDKRDFDKAISDFNEAIRLDPNNAPAHTGRGFAYGSKGNLDKAISDYSEAIRLDPSFFPATTIEVLRTITKGQFEKAISDFNAAIRLIPFLLVRTTIVRMPITPVATTTRRLVITVRRFSWTRVPLPTNSRKCLPPRR
jgi:tetratricopeptide (TPR) repeat protein